MGNVPLVPAQVSRWAGALVCLGGLLGAASAPVEAAGLSGRVLHASDPVSKAAVYAYRVVEKSFQKVDTDDTGEFLFEALPAGLYKIVAHKVGLPPAVLVLARRSEAEAQFVQVELAAADSGQERDDFWSTRASVPSDVLRDLRFGAVELVSAVTAEQAASRFHGSIAASTQQAEATTGDSATSTLAELSLAGVIGALRLELEGEFGRLQGGAGASQDAFPGFAGDRSALRLGVAGERSELSLDGERRQWFPGEDEAGSFAFDQLQLRYSGELGERLATSLVASYVDESGLFRRSSFIPAVFPYSSRWLAVQGTYDLSLGDFGSLRGGARYRSNELDRMRIFDDVAPTRFLDAWSHGEAELTSTYLVEYGVFSTFRDGRVAVSPRGGIVLRFHPEWQASLGASRRFVTSDNHPLEAEFSPATVEEALSCSNTESICVEGALERSSEGADHAQLRASWREFDTTVRVVLDTDHNLVGDGLFFVPGDRLPEIQATFRKRLGDSVVATWNSRYAQGGGGVFRAANRRFYENDVTYFGSSIDARFEPSSTGVFLAFHRLDQQLERVGSSRRRFDVADTQLDRVELVVSQDLTRLFSLASDWAVQVGLEFVRGQSFVNPIEASAETRRSLTTGLAVRF